MGFLFALVTLACHGCFVSLELVAGNNDTIDWGLHAVCEQDNVACDDKIVMEFLLGDFSVSEHVTLYIINIRFEIWTK